MFISLFWMQELLREAHEVELKKKKVEDKLERQLAYNKADTATEVQLTIPLARLHLSLCFWCCWWMCLTFFNSIVRYCVFQETILREQVEGLVEESEEEEEKDAPKEDGEEVAVGAIAVADKKTERQRKREKAEKIKVRLQEGLKHPKLQWPWP